VNDPYSGGTHLMDVRMVKPFYYQGELFCYMANTGHWPDMGGSVPGGFGTKTTEIYQEGLRIPPVKLYEAGRLNEDILTILLANIRVAEERHGDLQAHLAAFRVGERRLTHLLDKYGTDTVRACIAELYDRAEQQMRACIADIPDGTYAYTDYLDSDGVVNEPLRLELQLTVSGSEVRLDFSNSSPPCRGPMNSVIGTTKSACYIALKHTFPDVLLNAGCFRPIHIEAPVSTFLNASLPRPVAGCAAEVSQRIIDVVMGALAQAMPEHLSAGAVGTVNNLTIGGTDSDRGPYVMYMFNGGGYGGFNGGDGLTYGCGTISVSKTQPIEVFEQRYPVRIRQFALREESAGAGQYRGGFGAIIETEFLQGEGTASFIGDRGRFGPRGMHEGADGAKCRVSIVQNGETYIPEHLTKDDNVRLQAGDVIRLETPGGGGYGNPLQRDIARVVQDVRLGYISRQSAREVYGVVLHEASFEVDEDATQALRRMRLPEG
ncbi:MAG: hydantoinase B/oxoprolinase family protein, partial [bacterium]|nr:hydantoinase B/oxoprolinase family protein [bacterium]